MTERSASDSVGRREGVPWAVSPPRDLPPPYYWDSRSALYQGEAIAVLRALPAESADALITDPPYSSGGRHARERARPTRDKYQNSDTRIRYPAFAGEARDQRSYFIWWVLWGTECLRVLKPGAPVVVFSDWRQYPVVSDALQVAGFVWRGTAVWDKTGGSRPLLGRFRQQAEFVLWGSSGAMRRSPDVGALPGVFSHSPRSGGKHHLVGKPVGLMADLVRIAAPDELVLDPFAGSGSTGVACRRSSRRFLGIELVEDYAHIAASRLAAAAEVGG